MAEQEKETSSEDPKKKSSMLDEDIGKEFLSSWKSISMTMMMEWILALTLFLQARKRHTTLTNRTWISIWMMSLTRYLHLRLDSFNLDSCLTKGDMTLNSRLNKNVITAGGSDHGATRRPKPSDAESIHASKDSVALKSLATDREETSKEKTFVCNPGDRVSTSDDSFSKFASSGDLGMSVGARTSSDICKTSTTEERDQERELPEKTKSSESKSQGVINKPLSNLVEQNDSEQESIPDQHIEPSSQGKNVVTDSGDKQKANHYKVTSVNSDGENLPSEKSPPLHIYKSESNDGEVIKLDSSTQGESTNDLQPVKSDPHIKDNKNTGFLKKISDDKVSQKSTLDCQASRSKLTEDKEIQGRL
ncbi:hypothetical protein L6164_036790 [Bauhinia variegata]|uniref:Uncharacterized protein n=1 Tax=Bauhinia variegata TaxID=167791 RepID=A0ACB9KI53_BAUVA|nr:hypothetical protein L6164_036790 [Bauhinia variegata]